MLAVCITMSYYAVSEMFASPPLHWLMYRGRDGRLSVIVGHEGALGSLGDDMVGSCLVVCTVCVCVCLRACLHPILGNVNGEL